MWYNTIVIVITVAYYIFGGKIVMGVIQIVSGVVLILCSIFIVVITLMQSQKQQGMTSAIGGSNNDSFYGKNAQNTREKALERLTKIVSFIFFVVVIGVNVISVMASKG